MIGNWCKMTTTAASGATAVAGLTAVSGYPPVGDLFPDGAMVAYVILDSADKPLEAGIGKKTSATNIDRLKIKKTYLSSTYDDTDPIAATLVSATEYHVIITGIDATFRQAMPGMSTTWGVAGVFSAHADKAAGGNITLVDDTQYLMPFDLHCGGVVKKIAINVTTASANTAVQVGVYQLNEKGEPDKLLARTADIPSTTTGRKEIALITPVWLAPGYLYAVSVATKDSVGATAPAVFGYQTYTYDITPWGLDSNDHRAVYSMLKKVNASWTDLADVNVSTGWTATTWNLFNPAIALIFE